LLKREHESRGEPIGLDGDGKGHIILKYPWIPLCDIITNNSVRTAEASAKLFLPPSYSSPPSHPLSIACFLHNATRISRIEVIKLYAHNC
jgi:hypothetical protein